MNAKKLKILTKYAKAWGYEPKSVKKEFAKETKENQKYLLEQMEKLTSNAK